MPSMSLQSILSLAAAGLGGLFFLYLLAEALRGKATRSSWPLALAVLCGAAVELLDWLVMMRPEDLEAIKPAVLVFEGAQTPAWLAFTVFFARVYEDRGIPLLQKLFLGAACLLPLAAAMLYGQRMFYAPDFATERLLFLEPPAFVFYLAMVVLSVVGLFNLEATIANAAHFRRWKIKFTVIGVVAVLAAQILYYSQGFLNRAIDMNLVPARSLALFLGIGLMWYSRAKRGPEVQIVFSRRLAFKSMVLVLAGLYLIGLGVVGEGARIFGEGLSRVLVLAAGILGGVAVLVLSLSESMQRKVRLFLQRNFYHEKYDYRIQWMQFTERLAAAHSREALYQAILLGYCEVFGIEGAMLFLLDHAQGRFQPVSRLEMDSTQFAPGKDHRMILDISRDLAVLDLRSGDLDPALGKAGATFCVPLVLNQSLDGFILLGPAINEGENYDNEDFELMRNMALHVAAALLNLRLTEQLGRARDMEVMGKVSTFIVHDLKNLVYTLSLVVENANQHIAKPEFQQDMLATLNSTVSKMKVLISQLKVLPGRQNLKLGRHRLMQMARESCRLLPGAEFRFQGDDAEALIDAEEMQKVFVNLCLNAVEASGDKPVTVEVIGGEEECVFRVCDEGCGMDVEHIRENLFVPFKSTKAKGMGIGLYQCKQIVEAHGGRIEVESEPGKGSVFTVVLPGCDKQSANQ